MSDQKTIRVKILDAHYESSCDMVLWKIKVLSDNRELTLVWPGVDLGEALGIKKAIPPDLMLDFCNKVIGKELNLVLQADITVDHLKKLNSDIKNMDMDQILKEHSVFDKYQYYEILQFLSGQKSEN